MSLLNQRLIQLSEPDILNESVEVDTDNNEDNAIEDTDNDNMPNIEIPQNKSDEEVDTHSNTYQDSSNEPTSDVQAIDLISNQIDKLEDEMELNAMFGDDNLIETVSEACSELMRCSTYLNRDAIKIKAAQYKILEETIDEDEKSEKLKNFHNSTIVNSWKRFIDILSSMIEKLKQWALNIAFKAANTFDYYGKLASKYEELIKKMNIKDSTKMVEIYNWDTSELFSIPNFDKIHELSSIIIGESDTVDGMRSKLDAYYERNWSQKDVYTFVIDKCLGIKINGNNKDEILNKLIDKIRGTQKTTQLSNTQINEYIKNLKGIKPRVIAIAGKSKLKMVNPKFNKMLNDAKREYQKTDESSTVAYRYYRERYGVLSTVQTVAFDIYTIKMNLIKEYANDLKRILSDYVKENKVNNESIDFLSMNNSIIPNADVLCEV